MTPPKHDPATQASGDRLSSLLTDSKPAASIPHPKAALISNVLALIDRAEIQAAAALVQAAGRAL